MDNDKKERDKPTLGSLFAGIGGIDVGFETAGWKTRWQVELNPTKRAVLGDRFPNAERFEDVRQVGAKNLAPVDCIAGGFPCQDISNAGSSRKGGRRGLRGDRSGLFWEVMRVVDEVQPTWLVLENVPALLHTNDSEDIEAVIGAIAERGYLGFFRVLNAQYFGVPQKRERIFLVAGYHRFPTMDFLADAVPVEALPCAFGPKRQPCPADDWAGHTLQALNSPSRISIGSELLVAEENRWGEMAERARKSQVHGIRVGLDEINVAEKHAAGDAVVPAVAEWIAWKLLDS